MSSNNTSSEESDHSKSDRRFIVLSVVATVLLAIGIYAAGLLFGFSPAWYQGYAPEQPIPFSHKVHAGNFKIPCLYCHGSAEFAAHAEVPGLELCMNCHQAVKIESPWIKELSAAYANNQPVAWVKVHVMPDFVRFNHSRHIAAGVECQTCHGPIHEMEKVYQYAPMTMGWCVDCHRNDNYLQSHRVEFSEKRRALKGEGERSTIEELLGHKDPHNADISCSTCHY